MSSSVTFKRWLTHHSKAFPGFAKWSTDNREQLGFMEKLLEPYTFEQLAGATDRLYAQVDQPKGYSNHGRAIKDILLSDAPLYGQSGRTLGPTVRDGHLVAKCPRCMDYGMFSVLSPKCLERLWADRPKHGLQTCVIACTCENGSYVSRTRRLVQYQEGRAIIPFEKSDWADLNAAWTEARRLLLEYHERRHVHPDFQDYA